MSLSKNKEFLDENKPCLGEEAGHGSDDHSAVHSGGAAGRSVDGVVDVVLAQEQAELVADQKLS